MSDVEEQQLNNQEVEVAAQTSAPGELSIEDAIKGSLRNALVHQGLARGLREAVKAITADEAQLCILVESVDEAAYLKLIESLCAAPEVPIPLIKVSDPKALGEWAGLGKIDRDGNARKVVGCSCVVIKNWGVDSPARETLLKHFQA